MCILSIAKGLAFAEYIHLGFGSILDGQDLEVSAVITLLMSSKCELSESGRKKK